MLSPSVATRLAQALPPEILGGATLTRAAIIAWYHKHEPAVPTTTIDWRLYELVRDRVLARRGRGRYALAESAPAIHFQPEVTAELRSLWKGLASHLGDESGCLWTTAWLHDWMRHQPSKELLMVEVPRAALSTAFYHLLDVRRGSGVFLNPDERTTGIYVAEAPRPLLVQPLVSRAPVQWITGVPVPKLEKLLVDVFADPISLATYQGAELRRIFEESIKRYVLDPVTLWRYAGRRKRADSLKAWLKKQDDPTLRNLLMHGPITGK